VEKINLFRSTQYYFDDNGPLGYITITKMQPYILKNRFIQGIFFDTVLGSRHLTYLIAYEKD